MNYNSKGKYYPGKISRINSNGTYDIKYDDGDSERGVKRSNIKVAANGGGNGSDTGSDSSLSRGTKVTVNYNGKGKYFPGQISRVNSNGTYDIKYDDGDSERGVKRSNIKVAANGGGNGSDTGSDSALSRGTKVTVNYNGKGKYYPGQISRVNSNGTYDIKYDDGDSERGVKKSNIKTVNNETRSHNDASQVNHRGNNNSRSAVKPLTLSDFF